MQLLSGIDVSDAVEVNNPEANFPTTTLAGAPGKKKNAQVICCVRVLLLPAGIWWAADAPLARHNLHDVSISSPHDD